MFVKPVWFCPSTASLVLHLRAHLSEARPLLMAASAVVQVDLQQCTTLQGCSPSSPATVLPAKYWPLIMVQPVTKPCAELQAWCRMCCPVTVRWLTLPWATSTASCLFLLVHCPPSTRYRWVLRGLQCL